MCRPLEEASTRQKEPRGQRAAIIALCLVSAAHSYSLSNFFSYAGFLAVDFGWSPDLDHTGTAVGILGTCLPLARVPVSMLWGIAMDKFGRKPCIVLTASCLLVGQVVFPLMKTWWPAVIMRFTLLGMGNGWVILMAVCCAEIGMIGEASSTQILGYVIGAGGVINLIGPGIGGYTYGLLGSEFPALLPNLVGAGLAGVAAVAGLLLLPETRPARRASGAAAAATTSPSDQQTLQERRAVPAKLSGGGNGTSLNVALRTYPLPLLVCLRCVLGFAGERFRAF